MTTHAPPWYLEAQRLAGLQEKVAGKSNAAIMGWAKKLGGWIASFYKDTSIPWCGLACAHFIGATLPKEKIPANPLGAINWATWGRPLKGPALGAVLVFKRPGGAHVALYAGEDKDTYLCLGGNQLDSICLTRIAKSRLVAIRWPLTWSAPAVGPIYVARSGAVSKNEA